MSLIQQQPAENTTTFRDGRGGGVMLKRVGVIVFSALLSALLCRGAEAVLGFNLNPPVSAVQASAGAEAFPAWATATNSNMAIGTAAVVLSTTTAGRDAALPKARLLAEKRATYRLLAQCGLLGGGKK